MAKNFWRIWLLSSKQSRTMVIICFLLMVANALAELVSLGSIIPFIYSLSNPEKTMHIVTGLQRFAVQLDLGEFPRKIINTLAIRPIETTAAILLGGCILSGGIRIYFLHFSLRTANQITRDFSLKAYSSALYLPYEKQLSQNSSEIIASLSKASSVTSSITNILGIFNSLILTLFLVSALCLYQAQVAIPIIIFLAALYLIFGSLNRRSILAGSRAIAKSQIAAIKTVQESLGAIREILLEDLQKNCVERYDIEDTILRKARARVNFIAGYPKILFEVLGIIVLVGISIFSLSKDGFTAEILPTIGAFAFAGQKLLPNLHQIFSGWAIISNHSASVLDVL